MRYHRAAAIFANQKLALFQSLLGTPSPDFGMSMMFYRYAAHMRFR